MTIKQENDLLLIQLHNVQEELEHYYKKYQELKSGKIGNLRSGVSVIESLKINEKYEDGSYQELKLIVKAIIDGQEYNDLQIKLSDYNGVAALVIRQEGNGHLLEWPHSMKDSFGGKLLIKVEDNLSKEVLLSMTSSDWLFVSGLVVALNKYFFTESASFLLKLGEEGKKGKPWLALTKELAEMIDDLPSIIRWDQVCVREAEVTEDYERIWLELKSMLNGKDSLGDYHFKLVLNDSDDADSSVNVSLVLREQDGGGAPLSSWPPSNVDAFGPVLTLPCDMGAKSIVEGAFPIEMISSDRELVNSIVGSLPLVIDGAKEVFAKSKIPSLLSSSGVERVRSVLAWDAVELFENFNAGQYVHLGLKLYGLRHEERKWECYEFKIFIRQFSEDDLTNAVLGVELRNFDTAEAAPLNQWPPSLAEYDDYGALLRINIVDSEPTMVEGLEDLDRLFLKELVGSLPKIIDTLEKEDAKTVPELCVWRDVLQGVIKSVEGVSQEGK